MNRRLFREAAETFGRGQFSAFHAAQSARGEPHQRILILARPAPPAVRAARRFKRLSFLAARLPSMLALQSRHTSWSLAIGVIARTAGPGRNCVRAPVEVSN